MHIVFHGEIAAPFSEGFADVLKDRAEIIMLPDHLATEADRRAYASADVIVSFSFKSSLPGPDALKLFHLPGAGYDAVDFNALPASAVVCNCFGHEQPIAEYVMSAMLMRQVAIVAADQRLRHADWSYRGAPSKTGHTELVGRTIGLLGFGHIGRAIAIRAKAFEMNVNVANRSAVPPSPIVDRAFRFDDLPAFWASADFIVVSLPLTPETKGIMDASAFGSMRPTAVVINVGRGPTIDENALYEALKTGRIAGAVIDTWYNYPTPASPNVYPSALPFQELPNIVMTPHMSGLTAGTVQRRQRVIADNIRRRMSGETCTNIVWPTLA